MYQKHESCTFYEGKALVEQLLAQMHIPATWHKVDASFAPWFIPYQTAEIRHNDTVIGYAGLSHPLFFKNIAPGSAFMFELDGDFLTQYQPDTVRMQPLCKFPDIVRDISLLAPMTITVDALKTMIQQCDKRIISVEIQDFFEYHPTCPTVFYFRVIVSLPGRIVFSVILFFLHCWLRKLNF